MSAVWVVLSGMDSEGGSVVGVTTTAEAGKALADKAYGALKWQRTPEGDLPDGITAEWTARTGSASWVDVARWKVECKVAPTRATGATTHGRVS